MCLHVLWLCTKGSTVETKKELEGLIARSWRLIGLDTHTIRRELRNSFSHSPLLLLVRYDSKSLSFRSAGSMIIFIFVGFLAFRRRADDGGSGWGIMRA